MDAADLLAVIAHAACGALGSMLPFRSRWVDVVVDEVAVELDERVFLRTPSGRMSS
jgi:hypothetical protein